MTHPPMIPLSRRLVFADLCHPFLGTDMKYVEILDSCKIFYKIILLKGPNNQIRKYEFL